MVVVVVVVVVVVMVVMVVMVMVMVVVMMERDGGRGTYSQVMYYKLSLLKCFILVISRLTLYIMCFFLVLKILFVSSKLQLGFVVLAA